MEQGIIILVGIFLFPFVATVFLYGATLFKRLWDRDWNRNKGLQKDLQKWSQLTPEERMEASIPKPLETRTEWLDSPTPLEEERQQNEEVVRAGLLHNLPLTEVETPKEAENTRPTQ